MGYVRIVDKENSQFCYGCNTTDTVFGPLMSVPDDRDIENVADDFEKSLGRDPRKFTHEELCNKWNEFVTSDGSE
jgi:hypothetical protein